MLDFRKQNLRGRSFYGQDLVGADFSDADIRGIDFRGADLTNAKFCKAGMGLRYRKKILLLLASLFIGFSAGLFVAFGNNVFGIGFKSIAEYFFAVEKNNLIYVATLIYLVGLMMSIWFTLRKQDWRPLICYFLITAAFSGAAVGAGPQAAAEAGLETGPSAVLAAAMGMISVTVVGAAVSFEALAAVESVAGVAAVTIAGLIPLLAKNGMVSGAGGVAIAVISIASALVGWYLSHRSLNTEEPLLLPLRKLRLVFRCWGGTDFRGATLVNTDFSEADFKNANFYGSTIIRCKFQNALNLHLANTLNTPLEPLAVRQLVLDGQTEIKDFSYHNLRGVVFAGLNLQACKFHHADLSEADMRGCILKDCDFTETMAYGALFDHAEFSAAIIDNWSIDKTTQFNDAKAKFVYLKRDKSECNPPQGEFKDGDFAKLYQDIANTVDFIAHTPAELQALLRAIEKIKADGGDIFIQQMERKADSVVLRVQSECDVEMDKAAIYAQVDKQKEIELTALKHEFEQKLLIQQNEMEKEKIKHEEKAKQVDLLAGLLHKAIEKPFIVNTGTIGEITMNNNSRTIQNSTIQNSSVNLGDNSAVTNRIQQLPDSQGELKEVLIQLIALLKKSNVTISEKQKVEQEIKILAEIAQKPADERKSTGGKVITALKDLTSIFKDFPEMGLKYGELLAKLWMLI